MLPAPVSKRLPPLFDIAIDDVRGTEGESVATPTGLTGFCGAAPALAAAPMGAGEMRRWRVRGVRQPGEEDRRLAVHRHGEGWCARRFMGRKRARRGTVVF